MDVELITIGDEILIGQIVDTNSAWMAAQLNALGIEVARISSISDKQEEIISAVDLSLSRSVVTIMTGGLGPTRDDLTRQALSTYFNSPLRRDPEVLAHIEALFSTRNLPLLEANSMQADVLEIAEVLPNKAGTAPGMYIQQKGAHLFVLPGVPSEMRYLMRAEVLPRLKAFPNREVMMFKTLLTAGVGESQLAMQLSSVEDELPPYISLAYLPAFGQVRLRLSGKSQLPELLSARMQHFEQRIRMAVGEALVGEGEITLEEALLDYMKSRQLTLSAAESCTGGSIAHSLTLVPGSSQVFMGGVVAYTNAVKEKILGVPKEILDTYGAVSEETVRAMAEGVRARLHTDLGIATTGIAGPGGGTTENPVGTVWIAVASAKSTWVQRLSYDSIRERIIERASKQSLIQLFRLLYSEYGR